MHHSASHGLCLSLSLSFSMCLALLSWAWSTSLLALIKLLSLILQLELRSWWVTAATTSLTKPDAFRSGQLGLFQPGLVWLGRHLCTFCTFWANKSVSQSASQPASQPGLTSSRGSTLIFEQRTLLATLESFFSLLPVSLLERCSCSGCLSAVVDYSRISSAKQGTWQANWESWASWAAPCGTRHAACGLAHLCVAYKFSLYSRATAKSAKIFSCSVKQNKNEAKKKEWGE